MIDLHRTWVSVYESVFGRLAPRLLGKLYDRTVDRAMATDVEVQAILRKANRCGYAPPVCQVWDARERMYSMIFLEKLTPGAIDSKMGHRVVSWRDGELFTPRFSTKVTPVACDITVVIIDADYLYDPENFVIGSTEVVDAFVEQESRVD